MSKRVFDRETMLDLSVNLIPLGILLFFVALFAVVTPFPFDSVIVAIQMSIVILTGIGLAILTYYSGVAITGAEEGSEEHVPPGYSEADAEVERPSE